jgi:transcriptional regulator with XRE-family HTH domain
MPGERQTPTVRLRRLAAELRSLRTSSGLTRDEIVERTGINVATLYRIEHARVRPQTRTLRTLLDLYGVEGAHRDELIALLRDARQRGWLHAYQSVLPEQYTTYIGFEGEARGVWNYESLFVPGLLQTEDYARAVITGVLPLATEDEVEHRVEARLQRQAVLAKKKPLRLWAIVDEAVLHRLVGGENVMAKQLQLLVAASRQPHVTVQVLPCAVGAHPGMLGSFVVMDFPDAADPDLVYIESMAGDLFLERDVEVRRYAGIFEHLRAAALSPADSVGFIADLTETI